MTPEQIELVKSSWAQMEPIADTAAKLFYGKLFELDPTLRPLFTGSIAGHGRKFVRMVDTAVNGLDRLDQLLPDIKDLGMRHSACHVKDAHYDTVGTALLWTLHQGLGAAFTTDVATAWATLYTLLADTMKRSAGEAVAA
jgi:hemoglobin-like flavoprotein